MLRLLNVTLILALTFGTSWLSSSPTLCAQDPDQHFESQIAKVAKIATESIIGIETIGGSGKVDGTKKSNGAGTGVVVDSEGYVLTAAYFVADEPSGIVATLPDGKRIPATVVAHDRSRNLVLLKIKISQKLNPFPLLARDQLKVGQTVIAVGKGYDVSSVQVSTGVISATDRVWGRAIQTDAKVSPANYGGPLLDLRGRLCGIMAPLSPRSDKVMEGTDWYDSGIGFAVPVDEMMQRLDKLKAGEDLLAGKLGISFAGRDIYVDDCKVAFCTGSSPAGKAGIRPGDVITSLNGIKTQRQAQLKHALGPLYAGEEIKISVRRGDEVLDLKATLTGELEAYVPVAIGLAANKTEDGIKVRSVETDGPAEKAGIEVGDVIQQANKAPIDKLQDLVIQIAATASGKELSLNIDRDGESKDFKLQVDLRKATIPPFTEPAESDAQATSFELKIAEAPNTCLVIKPTADEDADSDQQPPAILVWLLPAGEFDRKKIEQDWKAECQNQNTMLLAIAAADKKKWTSEEAGVVGQALNTLAKQSKFDKRRAVIGGSGNGGTMASIVCFSQAKNFQGLVLQEAELSLQAPKITTDPVAPMMVLVTEPEDVNRAAAQTKSLAPVVESKTPIENVIRLTPERILAWVNFVDRL